MKLRLISARPIDVHLKIPLDGSFQREEGATLNLGAKAGHVIGDSDAGQLAHSDAPRQTSIHSS